MNHWVPYLFSSQKVMNGIPLQYKGIQISRAAFCSLRPQAGPGVYDTNGTPLMDARPIHRDRSTHLYNTGLAGPATWSGDLPESLSGLTLDLFTSSAGSPSVALRVWGPWVCVMVCMFATHTKESDLMWHERQLKNPASTGVNWRVHNTDSPAEANYLSPESRWLQGGRGHQEEPSRICFSDFLSD